MSYLLAAYGFATLALAGYVLSVVRQARVAAARLREVEREG